ncbi:MAG: ATP-binding protein [bacterium]|jgi:serine/threonine-protein kinase RsbW|nr:ATP-binding protein [bacterium]
MSEMPHPKQDISLEITAQPQYLSVIRHFISCLAQELNFSTEEALQLEMCVDEACANSICAIHDKEGPEPKTKVKVDILIDPSSLKITIHDSGKDFSPHFQKALPIDEHTDRTQFRGYGLQIIKTFMDDVQYDRDPAAGNHLHMIKYFSESAE